MNDSWHPKPSAAWNDAEALAYEKAVQATLEAVAKRMQRVGFIIQPVPYNIEAGGNVDKANRLRLGLEEK